MDWIKYGKTGVWVSIGVIISSVTFWELTKDPYIDAQAVAEVSAALRERTVITALRRDDLPQWGEDPGEYEAGRTIGPYISTQEIYDHILDPARQLFVNGAPGWYHDAIEPLWCLDTNAFEHGQVLVTMPYEYGPLTNNIWGGSTLWKRPLQRIPGTPAVDHVYTTATRWPWGKMNLEPGSFFFHGHFLTNAPFAQIFEDPSVPSPEIQEKDGGPWYDVGLGTNAYRLDCEVGALTNPTVLLYASSNNILQAAAMLEPLKRTIHVVGLGSCQCTQAVIYSGGGVTNWVPEGYSSSDLSYKDPPDLSEPADLIAAALANATVHTQELTSTGWFPAQGIWSSSRGVSGSGIAEGWGRTYDYPYGGPSESSSLNSKSEGAVVDWTDTWLPVIRPPVPSAYACASGLVSRVQVFGVFIASANPFYNSTGHPYGYDTNRWTLESSSCIDGPHSPPGPGYAYISSHLLYPPSRRNADREEGSDQFPYAVSGEVTLSLLVDEEYPQTPPEFSLGVQGGIRPVEGEAMSSVLWGRVNPPKESSNQRWGDDETGYYPYTTPEPGTDPEYSAKNGNLEYLWNATEWDSGKDLDFGGQTRIELITFIVVIDWNWEHLNRENPFVPEEHEPEWMKQPDE